MPFRFSFKKSLRVNPEIPGIRCGICRIEHHTIEQFFSYPWNQFYRFQSRKTYKASSCAFTQRDAFVLSILCRIAFDPVTANYNARRVPKIEYRLERHVSRALSKFG
jgi:hypothetical protein